MKRDPADTVDREERIPADFKGNYVWTAATNLAWREMMDSILHGPATFSGLSASTQEIVRKLNASQCSKLDLDPASYYIKSGFGNQTVDEINAALESRFPHQFEEMKLPLRIARSHFLNYAVFSKSMAYQEALYPTTLKFNNLVVKGFHNEGEAGAATVGIVHYTSDDQFILRLIMAGYGDIVLLAKGYPMEDPGQALAAIDQFGKGKLENLNPEDIFAAPGLRFGFTRHWPSLLHHNFTNLGFEQHQIEWMEEKIEFGMNRLGIQVKSAARYIAADSIGIAPPKPKTLLLDKPYWVILKRVGAPRPYFILGVRNAAMMTPVAKK